MGLRIAVGSAEELQLRVDLRLRLISPPSKH
jgi:hypothetical protein